MSSTPERPTAMEADTRTAHRDNTTSQGNSLGSSILLSAVLFLIFAAGLWVLSFMTPVLFLVGLGICLLSLFLTFTVVPKYLT